MAAWCMANADQLGEELTWQIGRPIAQSPGEIRRGFHERVKYMSGIAEETLADLAVEKKAGFQRFIRREPLGAVLVLAPWNYPWLTSVNAVVPALLAGNTVVLKMAQQTPLVAERYRQAFAAAGLPDGAFQFLTSITSRRRASSPTPASASSPSPARSAAAMRCSAPRPGASSPPASSSAARTRRTCGPTRRCRRRQRTWSPALTSTRASHASRWNAYTCSVPSSS